MQRPGSLDTGRAMLANLLVFGVVIYAWALLAADADRYYLAVQEDEYLEWASFWAFANAAWVATSSQLMP